MPSKKRLWKAYAVAPLVAPLMIMVVAWVWVIVFSNSQPATSGVRQGGGLILFAVTLWCLFVGVPFSYAIAGLIVMPIVFSLRRRNLLNGHTIHQTALQMFGGVLALGLVFALIVWSLGGDLDIFVNVEMTLFLIFGVLASILLSGTTFWFIGVRA
jgi:hypothetical protein